MFVLMIKARMFIVLTLATYLYFFQDETQALDDSNNK